MFNPDKHTYIAQRCEGYGHPQNSEFALISALASEADEVEIELQKLSDGSIITGHTPLWMRNSTEAVMNLETMMNVLKERNSRKGLRIDIKSSGFEEVVVNAIVSANLQAKVTFTSNNLEALKKLKSLSPTSSLSYRIVVGGYLSFLDWGTYQKSIKAIDSNEYKDIGVTLESSFGVASRKIVADCLKHGRNVTCVVSQIDQAHALAEIGVTTFLSSSPLKYKPVVVENDGHHHH